MGFVGAIQQGFLQSWPVLLEMLRKLFDSHPVDSGSASVAPNLPERTPEVIRLQYTFQKVVLSHRSVVSPYPRGGFIPMISTGNASCRSMRFHFSARSDSRLN